MKGRKRLIVAVCLGVVLFTGIFIYHQGRGAMEGQDASGRETGLVFWYTDATLEEYMTEIAYCYGQEFGVRVLPVLKSRAEYLEAVNRASLSGEGMPDLYMIDNDALEKAALLGLAEPVADGGKTVNETLFPTKALQAVSYRGRPAAYPFSFEVCALLYNRSFLQEAANERGESLETLLPRTIEDILVFADTYNAPETVEAVFRWDVSDIFYNYFFTGNEMDLGGPCGDDLNSVNLYNEGAVRGLQAYQELNQFFFADIALSDYKSALQDFLEGKSVFTVATTDAIKKLEAARADGSFPWEYAMLPLPDINESVKSRGLCVTDAIAINGYGQKQETANAFAAWLSTQGAKGLYGRTGKLPVQRMGMAGTPEEEAAAAVFFREYEKSVPLPKLMSMANFWVQMEIVYTKVWSGEDPATLLKDFSDQMMGQVYGLS